MNMFLQIALAALAICWSIAGLCFAYAQYRDAQAWDAPDDDDEDDSADWWKKNPLKR